MSIRFRIILVFCLWVLSACTVGLPARPTATTGPARTLPPLHTSTLAATLAAPASITPTATRPSLPAQAVRGQIIRFWHPWQGAEGQAMGKLVQAFNLENEWGIVIVPEAMQGTDEIQARLAMTVENDLAPDVVVGFLPQALNWRDGSSPAAKGLVDWQPYLDDPTWGISTTAQADFYPAVWESEIVQGQRLGIPALRSAQVLYYNRTWAGELEFFNPPGTPQQFADQACASAEALRNDETVQNDAFGGWIAGANYAASLSWIYSNGGEVVQEQGGGEEASYRFNTPAVEESFTFLKDLVDGRCAWFDEAGGIEMAFAHRQGLFASGSVMGIPYQAELVRQARRGDDWTVIPYPAPSNADPALVIYGPSYYLQRSSPERQLAAWLFVRWLSQPEQHVQMVEASSSFPIRMGELAALETFRLRYPAYQAALALLPAARSEPKLASWETVRWTLKDATTQLFRPYFKVDQIPTMLEYLDRTIAALLKGPEQSGVWDTPVPTPTTTAKP